MTAPAVATPTTTVKPGYKTTEFWLALVGKVVGVLGLLKIIDPVTATPAAEAVVQASFAALAAFSTLGYSISRGQTKKGALEDTTTTGNV